MNLIKHADILKTSYTINREGGLSYSFKDFNYEEACLITRAAAVGFGVIYHHYFVSEAMLFVRTDWNVHRVGGLLQIVCVFIGSA
jgi:hypothetical protein